VTPSAALAVSLFLVGDAVVGGANDLRFGFEAWRCGDALRSTWTTPDGRLVAAEKLDLEGERWVRYRLQRVPVAQEVLAERKGGEVTITIRNGDNSRRVTLRAARDLLAGPTLVSHLGAVAPSLALQQPIEFDYLIAEQGLVLRLRAVATSRRVDGGTTVKLEAASMLFRPFVPATTLEFDGDGNLSSLSGRLLPQFGDVKKPKSLDGVLRLRAGEPQSSFARMQSVCNKSGLS